MSDTPVSTRSEVSERGRRIGSVSEAPAEDVGEGTSETIYTNPWIAEYKRRQAMLMDMRAFEVIAMMRDLNLTSYAFSKNAEELQAHIWRYPEIGQSQPFNPDVGDPFGIELARLLQNSRSIRCATRTRACASRRESGPSTSRS